MILVTLVSRFSLIVTDLIGLYITWYRTHETVRLSGRASAHLALGKETFADTLLYNGAWSSLAFDVSGVEGTSIATR